MTNFAPSESGRMHQEARDLPGIGDWPSSPPKAGGEGEGRSHPIEQVILKRSKLNSTLLRRTSCLLVLLFALSPLQAAESATNAASRFDFSAYRIIAERNIFNTNRSARVSRSNRPAEKPRQVESLSLVGTLSYEKGSFAFFDGSRSDYRKACPIQGRIGEFTVQEIKPEGVKLTDSTNHYELTVGMAMRREDESPWRIMSTSEASPPRRDEEANSSSSGASEGPTSEILRRLREKRAKEMN